MLKENLHLLWLSLQNWYQVYDPATHIKGVYKYKTYYNYTTSDPEPMGGQGGNSFYVRYTTRRKSGVVKRKFREHALRKMVGLFPCSVEERAFLWKLWGER